MKLIVIYFHMIGFKPLYSLLGIQYLQKHEVIRFLLVSNQCSKVFLSPYLLYFYFFLISTSLVFCGLFSRIYFYIFLEVLILFLTSAIFHIDWRTEYALVIVWLDHCEATRVNLKYILNEKDINQIFIALKATINRNINCDRNWVALKATVVYFDSFQEAQHLSVFKCL